MSETTAESLLAEAAALWKQAKMEYRDARAAIGQKLHEYIIAYLVETNCRVQDRKRNKARTARSEAIVIASRQLGLRFQETARLVYTAKVIELLAPGIGIGKLSWTALFLFSRFLRRKQQKPNFHQNKVKNTGNPRDTETWYIKPEYKESAPALFRRAVAENWSTARVTAEVTTIYGASVKSRFGRAGQITPETREKVEKLAVTLRQSATPETVADVCTQLVQGSSEPLMVAKMIAAKVSSTKASEPKRTYTPRTLAGPGGKRKRQPTFDDEEMPTPGDVWESIAKGSPGDIAEHCLRLVNAAEDPWQVAQRLIVELQRIPRKKPRSLLYEAGQ